MHVFWKLTFATFALTFALSGCYASSPMLVTVRGETDPLEPAIQVDTRNYSKPYVISIGYQDWFLRGYIDKKTKTRSYQLYVIFNSAKWMYWDHARFNSVSGLVEYAASRVGSNESCDKNGCEYYEDVIVDIKRQTLDEWSRTFAVVRFSSSRVGGYRDIAIDPEEVNAFLRNMDEYAR
jgi:hypothetical protein